MSIETMKQALEAMEELHRTGDTQVFDLCFAPKVIPALRLAIEQAERQEPVAWMENESFVDSDNLWDVRVTFNQDSNGIPLYLAPPQRQPLTEEQIDAIWDEEKVFANPYEIARAIERKHGIGGDHD
jgi:hypothetical protein